MVFEKIKKVVAEQVSIDESDIKLQSTFNEELGLDSLELFEIVIALEDEFNIEIPNEELEGITNVQGLVSYIEEKIK
ncbi:MULTISPECIES: acyl carrier protein [Clostridium]|uniref:Acyl carrier protein n=1 Tax=Clostridium senegalense TaxID=1465809 RepID=A0A6M0H1G8_9CLOT|nr:MULTISPECIES: acyl carrier protein [Clostridium]NEU04357.1 acyl carrier protein [Clostridium senegalense]